MFLKNYEISMNIGVHDFEKRGEQRVIVNIDVYVALQNSTPTRDQISEVVNYEFMHDTIARIVSRGHIQLLETLCDEIACGMLEHPLVLATRVATEKPDVYPDCDGVGVEVFRRK